MKDCQFGVSPVNYSDSDYSATLLLGNLTIRHITTLAFFGNSNWRPGLVTTSFLPYNMIQRLDLKQVDMQGHGDYLLRPKDIAMPPNKSNDIINSFFTLPHTCSAVRFLNIYSSSLPYKKRNKNS